MVDPFPAYDRLRSRDPIHWSSRDHAWLITRYRDVATLVSDPSFHVIELAQVVRDLVRPTGKETEDLESVSEAVLFFRNPPEHGDDRRFMVTVLNATPVSALGPIIEHLVAKLLRPLHQAGRFDAVRDFADRLPPLVLGHLIGMPDEVVETLMETISDLSMSFDRGRSMRFYERVNLSVAIGRDILREAIAERRRQPREDGLTRMIKLSDAEYHLDDGVIASRALFLLAAGVETTSSLIGSAIRTILDHPDAAQAIRDGSVAPEAVVEEALRFDSPVQQASRMAVDDREIGGRLLEAGDRLVLLLGAANRDPEVFDRPNEFDVHRKGPPHLAFGASKHFCIGATLARLEARIAIPSLIRLAPIAEEGRWSNTGTTGQSAV